MSECKDKVHTQVKIGFVFPSLAAFGILWALGVIVSEGFWWTVSSLLVPFMGPGTAVYWIVKQFAGV